MRKRQILEEISSETGLTIKQSELVIGKIIDLIQDQVNSGNKFTIQGFGTFELSKRSARAGINPQTGKRVKIPARNIPRFRASKNFKEFVN